MANITFTSPRMSRDITVYAVAGDRGTVLAVAKAHHVPIPFDCQDGECGSCLIEVLPLAPKARSGVALTEKEKEMLRQLGKISKQEIVDAEVNDVPPRHRLACQCFVRNEDIMVRFEGDETLPAPAPHLSSAAKVYKGGMAIATVEEFMAYSVKLEQDAALHFEGLAKAMQDVGNAEVATLFSQLAGYSRLHLATALERAGAAAETLQLPPDYVWPDHATPERTSDLALDATLTRLDALRAALQGEQRGRDFYAAVAGTAHDAEIIALAKTFVSEENEHVRVLEGWLAREEWLTREHQL
jgi:rubrerythrin/ferredoxin